MRRFARAGAAKRLANVARQQLRGRLPADWVVVGPIAARRWNARLRQQLATRHEPFDMEFHAVAQRSRRDRCDVAYQLPDGRVAVVYLYSTPYAYQTADLPELADLAAPPVPRFPEFDTYASADTFASILNGALVCPACGANWEEGDFSEVCDCCGGGALELPCPRCRGACGVVWRRALDDTMDSGVAHWVGGDCEGSRSN